MSVSPTVSIIIPTLNSGKYFHRCLTSMEAQTYTQLEIIIVDAGSTDNTVEIISQFKSKLTIKSYVIGKSTQSEARNHAIQHSTGKYIAFCDSDDYYLKDKIQKQIDVMENSDIDVSYFDVLHFYTGQENQLFTNQHPQNPDILAECIANQTINLNSVMIRKRFLDKNRLLFPQGKMGRYGEDGNFIFQLAVNQAKFKKLPEHLSVVEIRQDSHTQWEAQWKMKYYAIQYLMNARPLLAQQYQSLIDQSVKKLKFKLVVSYILAKKYLEAKETLKELIHPMLMWMPSLGFLFLKMIPSHWVNSFLTTLWDKRREKIRHFYK